MQSFDVTHAVHSVVQLVGL